MTQAEVEFAIKKQTVKWLQKSDVRAVAKDTAKYINKIIIDRVKNHKDLYGHSFGGYNKSYDKNYAFNYAAKKGERFTEYASRREPLRLTGQLLSGITVRVVRISQTSRQITVRYLITVRADLKDQVEGLQSTTGTARNGQRYSKKAWYFLGISKQLYEYAKILKYFVNKFNKKKGH